ncbi:uromodulin-like 1 [Pristis pectinata]|uniref:uromodulin-like 1 n=1 Tax=Pristis pectinata TaxID=685728 RepID=UPI00223CE50D|nr:uromodulin-like 1 [Pristis pectinata]
MIFKLIDRVDGFKGSFLVGYTQLHKEQFHAFEKFESLRGILMHHRKSLAVYANGSLNVNVSIQTRLASNPKLFLKSCEVVSVSQDSGRTKLIEDGCPTVNGLSSFHNGNSSFVLLSVNSSIPKNFTLFICELQICSEKHCGCTRNKLEKIFVPNSNSLQENYFEIGPIIVMERMAEDETLNGTKAFASHPGMCPNKENATGNRTCRWDTDCPGLQKCCIISGESVCTSPIPATDEGYFNLLIEVKQDFEQTKVDLMNHLRFLYSVVIGALHSVNCSIYHLHTQSDGGNKTLSKLLLGTRPPTTLGNISKELQKVLINIDEICHLETKDINECEHEELNSCSLRATCSNTDGSHNCKCQSGFTDRDPSGRGRDCREVTTAVLIPESISSTATPIITDLERSRPNIPSTESPLCSPVSVTNLTIVNVTGVSFQVTWARDTSKNQTVTVRVLREDITVNEIETQEMNWTVPALEPAVLYTVEVYWQSCGNNFTKEIKVKTAALLLNGQVIIQNYNFSETLSNTSSSQFRKFLQLWHQEIERSLPPTIHQWYKSRKILARIKSLSYGSIVVNFEIVIDPGIQLNIWNASSALISSLYNSSVFEFNHNSTSISDVNECTSPIYNDCSPHAMCKNTEGSYVCICSDSYRDVNPAWPGRSCEESTTTVLTPASAQEQSSTVFASAMITYVNGPEFPASFPYSETPHCGPSPVVNLTISNVTSRGFQGTWSTDTAEEQVYIVQVLKDKSIVNETKTQEMEWSVSGLEASTEYHISVISRACEQESMPIELNVITAPSPVTNLTVFEVTGTSFLVTWTTETYYEQAFIVQLLKNDSIVNETETLELEWTVSGLEPETEYTLSIVCRAREEDSTATKLRVKTDPTPVINLTVSNVTTGSFHLTWTTDTYEDQTFNVQVLKNESIVTEMETTELEWTVSGLEPETKYTVSVVSRACEEESAATEMSVKTEALLDALSYTSSSQQSSTGVVSTMTIYPNTSGFPLGFAYTEVPPCSAPSPIINLTVFNITTKSFHITWTTDNYEEQTFIVQLLKNDSVVKETETLELALTISGLEPGTEYTVSVASRSCEQDGIATELNVKTAPSAVTNLAVSSITSDGFQVTWTTDTSEEQTYVVKVWKDNIIVSETETQELEWITSGLEPGTEYTVTVVSRVCEQESITVEQNVRTAARIMEGRVRIMNLMFNEGLGNSSSDQFKAFTEQFVAEILKSLPNYTANLLASGKFKIVVKSLQEGSVNVDFQVVFDEELAADVSEIIWDLVASLEDGSVFIFDPDSTDISDYNECASLEDNDCSFNAKCINTEGSYTCSCSDSFVDANPVQPGRNCREPIVANPITTTAAAESIMINCNLHEISVIMERSFLEARQIPASSLYLGNSHCNRSFGNLTHVALKVGWTECGTQISNNDTHTVVKTTLQNIVSSSTVSADGNLEVPVNCTFDNSLLLPAGYAPNGRNRMSLEGTENYMASIETFNGNQTLLEDPLLDPEDEVSIQVSIDTADNRAKLILAECWATPSNNATSDSLYTIIKTGCPVPGSQIKMSENGNSTSANFTLKVFSLISMPFVYIHCQTQVCLELNGSICQPSCSGLHSIEGAEVVAERTVSLGPLYRRYRNDDEPVVELDENISALRAVVGLGILLCLMLVVISAVMMTVYTRRGHSFTTQPTGPNYQAFDNY